MCAHYEDSFMWLWRGSEVLEWHASCKILYPAWKKTVLSIYKENVLQERGRLALVKKNTVALMDEIPHFLLLSRDAILL